MPEALRDFRHTSLVGLFGASGEILAQRTKQLKGRVNPALKGGYSG